MFIHIMVTLYFIHIQDAETPRTCNCLKENCIIYLKDLFHFLVGTSKDIMSLKHDSGSVNYFFNNTQESHLPCLVCVLMLEIRNLILYDANPL